MFDLQAALNGQKFEAMAEFTIRELLDREMSWDFEIDIPGKRKLQVQADVVMKAHATRVDIQDNGHVNVRVEIELFLKKLEFELHINDYLAAGERIPGTSTTMDSVPVAPVKIEPRAPLLLGVPSVSLRATRFEQGVVTPDDIELLGVVDNSSIAVTPNLGGVAQVLTRIITERIKSLIEGIFGQTYLARILKAVAGFLGILLRHIFQIGKLADLLLAGLVQVLVAFLLDLIGGGGSERKIVLGRVDRKIELAKSTAPGGKAAVQTKISQIRPFANVTCHNGGGEITPEVVLDLVLQPPT